MGLLNNVLPFSFLSAGQTMVSVGLAAIINGMTPLFTALLMALFREERLTTNRMVGVLLGVAGVVFISRPSVATADTRLLGIGLCLAGALSYGFSRAVGTSAFDPSCAVAGGNLSTAVLDFHNGNTGRDRRPAVEPTNANH